LCRVACQRRGREHDVIELADPGKIVLKDQGNATFDFSCGPQKPFSVAIEYAPAKSGGAGVAGAVRRIEF
jgi:hypothetical protein